MNSLYTSNYEHFLQEHSTSTSNRNQKGKGNNTSKTPTPCDSSVETVRSLSVSGRRRAKSTETKDPEIEGVYLEDELPNDLPDSSLLEVLHYYAARFYQVNGMLEGGMAKRKVHPTHQDETNMQGKMDGSALIALGVIMEETVKHSLGRQS
ncbi:hypothetical protein BT69DRAFT_1279215 [Atractiella rhizophila]|nr:hypothetical protein BT69DRAFT_1279215 [Atractiella rhizophila]